MSDEKNDQEWWTDFKDLQIEKSLKNKMQKFDPAKMDFSEDFFNNLHNEVMARVENKEILPKAKSPWYQASIQKLGKTIPAFLALLLMVFSATYAVKTAQPQVAPVDSISTKASQAFVQQSLASPQDFSNLMLNDSGSNDFFVDVASRNFDDLNRHAVESLLQSHKSRTR